MDRMLCPSWVEACPSDGSSPLPSREFTDPISLFAMHAAAD